MKFRILIFVLFALFTNANAQDFLYIRVGETFHNAKGEPMVARRFINLTNSPKVVPEGKIWMTVENKYINVEFSPETKNPSTQCYRKLQQKPHVMFNINFARPFEEYEKWGVIFSKYTKKGNTFEFIPDAFVREDFDFGLLKVMVPRMVGDFDIKFFPGTKVFVDKCIKNFQVIEVDMSSWELQRYNKKMAIIREQAEKKRLASERVKRNKLEQELKKKIDQGHIFELNELDEKPWFQLHSANFLELYKDIYYNKFFIDFIVNEDGSINILKSTKIVVDKKLLKDFLKYAPGKIIIGGKKIKVKTKMRIIFSNEGLKEITKSRANFKLKKRKKEPMYEIKEYPPNYTDRQLKKIIPFKTVLKNADTGNYEFNIEHYVGTVNIVIDGQPQEEIISQKIEKFRYKYKSKNSGWKF